jgi:hypothetical protein
MELIDKLAKTHPQIVTAEGDETIRVWGAPLDFYPSFSLLGVVVESEKEAPREVRYLYNEKELIYLDGSMATISQANTAEDLALTAQQIPPYLRYFFDYTDGGRLYLVESSAEVRWAREVTTSAAAAESQRQAERLIQPVRVSSQTDGGYQALATGIFATILVQVTFRVESAGGITPLKQQLLMEQLPVSRQYPRPVTKYSDQG